MKITAQKLEQKCMFYYNQSFCHYLLYNENIEVLETYEMGNIVEELLFVCANNQREGFLEGFPKENMLTMLNHLKKNIKGAPWEKQEKYIDHAIETVTNTKSKNPDKYYQKLLRERYGIVVNQKGATELFYLIPETEFLLIYDMVTSNILGVPNAAHFISFPLFRLLLKPMMEDAPEMFALGDSTKIIKLILQVQKGLVEHQEREFFLCDDLHEHRKELSPETLSVLTDFSGVDILENTINQIDTLFESYQVVTTAAPQKKFN